MFISYIANYEGVRIYESPRLGHGYNSGGIALPGLGIILGVGAYSKKLDLGLVQHEYGHFLQFRLIGWLRFYLLVGIPSLLSAWTRWHKKPHQLYWTELWANHLASQRFPGYYKRPIRFPQSEISPSTKWWLGIK
jgi:hypothetical protein